jgi:hypothetical protein
MAGFKATAAVSGLSYDFTGLEVLDDDAADLLDKAKGTTPEPSYQQVRHMQAAIKTLLGLDPDVDPAEINKEMARMSEEDLLERDEEFTDIIAGVTSGRPSRDEIAALPFRVREAYIGWVCGELNNPTAGTGSTRRSLAPVRNA